MRRDFADCIQKWLATKPDLSPNQPLFEIAERRTADMVRIDLEAARAKWIEEAKTKEERKRRETSSFRKYIDDNGHYADFHALRSTFITNLSRAAVPPKMAQTLARHSTIDLTMNTYTVLGVLDQAAAVESLPPVPGSKQSESAKRCASSAAHRTVNQHRHPSDLNPQHDQTSNHAVFEGESVTLSGRTNPF